MCNDARLRLKWKVELFRSLPTLHFFNIPA